MVRGSVAEISRKMQDGDLLEPGDHNMLVYDNMLTLRHLFVRYAKTFLPKNEILLFASQYDAIDNLKNALQESGVNVARHLVDRTLFIIDAQKGYQVDTRGTFKLAMSLISRARKEGRRGITWLGDVGSFFSFERIDDLVDYELYCPTKYEDIMKTICCYHTADFNILKKNQQDKLIQHHFKSIFVK